MRVADRSLLQQWKRLRPLFLFKKLGGFLQQFFRLHLCLKMWPAHDRGGYGLMHPGDWSEKISFRLARIYNTNFFNRLPANLSIAPSFSREHQPAALAVKRFFNFVIARGNCLVG